MALGRYSIRWQSGHSPSNDVCYLVYPDGHEFPIDLPETADELNAWRDAAKLAHDKMDDLNAAPDAGGECRFCGSPPPYDVDGIKHADDCVLVVIRKLGV